MYIDINETFCKYDTLAEKSFFLKKKAKNWLVKSCDFATFIDDKNKFFLIKLTFIE